MKLPTICITGGHLTPALAVIEEIRRRKLPWKIVFIGRSHAFEGGGAPTQEERLVSGLGAQFHALTTGRGTGLFKVPIGFLQALFWFFVHRPAVVLSFGGYIALPVAIAAWIIRIPVVTHEQTENLGLANRIIARFARDVIRASESGVPIRRALFFPPARPSFEIDARCPILYITGGSTGARSLNALVFPIVSELAKTWTVIHQVGSGDTSKAPSPHGRYVIAEYFDASDVAWIYAHAALLIARAGANTTGEVAALGVPALFIPLPWAAGGEQAKNAQKLEREGGAIVLDQETLTPNKLLFRIKTTMESIAQMSARARLVARTYPRDGARNVVKEVESIIV